VVLHPNIHELLLIWSSTLHCLAGSVIKNLYFSAQTFMEYDVYNDHDSFNKSYDNFHQETLGNLRHVISTLE
jgi:hypothetical protein